LPGITDYSIHIPRHSISRAEIAAAWARSAVPGTKAVANFDEDAITMAQSAAWPLRHSAGRLYFASTTSPSLQGSPAALIAAFSDLPRAAVTADFAHSLRCGTGALRAAFESVESGRSRSAVVVAADRRDGAPESAEEMSFGDGAAALAVGAERVIAKLIGVASISDEFPDEWRRDSDQEVRSAASRFTLERGYVSNMLAVGRELMREGPISRAVITSPDRGAHLAVAKSLGISEQCVEDIGYDQVGVTGAAMPLMLLARALDRAAPGDRILLLAHGDGADAFVFEVTPEIANLRRPRACFESRRSVYPTYQVYRKLREFLRNTDEAELSTVRWNHDETQNVRLHGARCSQCGTMQFPIPKVCVHCRATVGLVEKPLARTGSLYTFTKDTLYGGPVQPIVMAVVSLDDGARFLCQMTDVNEQEVTIGMRVEMVVRRMKGSPSTNYYYWKCRPVQEDAS
jgi:3-hydroxy-3-methylglutaryl CoA synthase